MKLKRFQKKGEAFYHVSSGTKRVWTPLGSNLNVAIQRYARIEERQGGIGTIGRAIDEFLASPPRPWAEGTKEMYGVYAGHLCRVFGHMGLSDLTRYDVLKYLDECPRTSALAEVSLLRQVLERAVRRGELRENVTLGAKPENSKKSKRTKLLTDKELEAIYEKACPTLRVAMVLGHLTALRPSDLCSLKWSDLEDGIKTRKTGVRLRFTMTEELSEALETAKALNGANGCETVVSENGRSVTPERLGILWRRARDEAGVEDAQLRDVRARAASDAYAAGIDPQALLGHANAHTTAIYVRGRQIKEVKPASRRRGGQPAGIEPA